MAEKFTKLRSDTPMLVVAIDFGTTYSGVAFSFRHEPKHIHCITWQSPSGTQTKTPTCLLLKANKTIEAFGADAQTRYEILESKNEHKDYYFFWRFKMTLHKEEEIHADYRIEDVFGKKLKAMEVFSRSIACLKDRLLKEVHNSHPSLVTTEIDWVITVPAIWKESGKKFMRKAAKKAGIPAEKLDIALEPEAASLWCMDIPLDRNATKTGFESFSEGTKYMIVDCGGGTVDVTMHEVLERKRLRELHKPTGGAWGGTKVDEAFNTFLISLIGAPVLMKLKTQHRTEYLSLFQNFELKKRSVPVDNNEQVTIQIPVALLQMCPNLSNDIKQTKYNGKVTVLADKIRISHDIFRQFFQDAVPEIVNHIQNLLMQVSGIQAILMVGGFSDSPFLLNAIKSKFEPQYVVITPQEAILCIMKGAVLYGHDPDKVKSRICPYTFGVAMTVPFIKAIHPETKKITIDGEDLCDDVFDKHVEAGAEVLNGEFQKEKEYYPLTDKDTILPIVLYSSASKSPKYIDEQGCHCVGKYLVFCNKSLGERKGDKKVKVRLRFGGTDVHVEAEDKNGKIHKAKFDFVNK